MISIRCIICFLLFSVSLNAQTTWFEEGTKWTYRLVPGFGGSFGYGDRIIELQGDTIINDIEYKVLSDVQYQMNLDEQKIDTTLYSDIFVRQENSTIYHLDGFLNEYPIYEFDAQVGDTLAMNAIVTEVGTLEYNGEILKTQVVNFICYDFVTGEPMLSSIYLGFTEKIGVWNQPFLFYNVFFWGCFNPPPDASAIGLRCYQDSSIGNLIFLGDECSSLQEFPSSNSEMDKSRELRYAKNQNHIRFLDDIEIIKVEIINLNGVSVAQFREVKSTIELPTLPRGIYVMKVTTPENRTMSSKFFH